VSVKSLRKLERRHGYENSVQGFARDPSRNPLSKETGPTKSVKSGGWSSKTAKSSSCGDHNEFLFQGVESDVTEEYIRGVFDAGNWSWAKGTNVWLLRKKGNARAPPGNLSHTPTIIGEGVSHLCAGDEVQRISQRVGHSEQFFDERTVLQRGAQLGEGVVSYKRRGGRNSKQETHLKPPTRSCEKRVSNAGGEFLEGGGCQRKKEKEIRVRRGEGGSMMNIYKGNYGAHEWDCELERTEALD